jgi:hypothetical protein
VADEWGHVHGGVLGDDVDQVAEALAPSPVDTSLEGGRRHLLDQTEHAREPVAVRGAHRGHAQRAVAGDDGGDAVLDVREHVRVEQQLGVDVRVGVDETGRDDAPARIDDPVAVDQRASHAHDASTGDTDVTAVARQTAAVDDGSVANDQIEHVVPSGSTVGRRLSANKIVHG